MKRPLFTFCLLFLAAAAAAQLKGGLSGLIPAAGALLASVCLPKGKRRAARQLFLCGALASLLALPVAGGLGLRLERWQALEGQALPFTAWVEEADPYSPGRFTLRGTVGTDDGQRLARLDVQGWGEEDPLPGQWFAGELLLFRARTDGEAPGGVTLYGWASGEPEPVPAPRGLHPLAAMAALRSRLSQAVWEEAPGEASSVVLAMVFSLTDRIPARRMAELERAGLRHLLVVSGLHLSILTGWLRRSGRRLGLEQRLLCLLSLLAVWGMAGLAGFTPSVLRAAGMTSLALLGQLFLRQADGLTSLGIAGALLCAFSPPVLFRVGFQLTFAATLGILLGIEPLSTLLENRWTSRFGPPGPVARWFLDGVSVCVCAQLGALPVLAAHFGGFTLWGLVFTIPAIPLVTGIILLGGPGAALLSLPLLAPAGRLLLTAARVLARAFLLLGTIAGLLPDASFYPLTLWQLALCGFLPAGAFLLLLLSPRLTHRRGRVLCRGSILLTVLILGALRVPARLGTVVSVRDGTAVISTPAGTLVLDAGESAWERQALPAWLLRCGARGPLVLVSTGAVSLNGLAWQQQELSPAAFLLPPEELRLLEGQLPGNYLPLGPDRQEALPGVFLRQAGEGLLLVEMGERKLLKSQASYAIIEQSPLLGDADLLMGRRGGLYAGQKGPRPSRMPTGDCNLLLLGG